MKNLQISQHMKSIGQTLNFEPRGKLYLVTDIGLGLYLVKFILKRKGEFHF